MTPWEALTLSRDSEFIQIDRRGVFRCSLSDLVDSIKSNANAKLQAEIAELKAMLAESAEIIEQRNAMLSREHADFMQALTDPENQPSQFGTVTLEMYQDLKAKLAEYEKQKPVATLHDDGYWTWIGTPPYESSFAGWRMNVYTKGTP